MKKRILLVNKFYYPRGGDCVATLNLEQLLKSKGHEVGVFAMNFQDNIPSEYSQYFASNINFSGDLKSKLKSISRIFGLDDVVASFKRILHDFKPDVVHFQNIHSYLSPVIVKLARQYGAKVVWTLHDYKLLCPSYSCLLNNKPCEICFSDKFNVVKHKCMKGSLLASSLAYFESLDWNRNKLEQWTDMFICPSNFMLRQMEKGNFSSNKLTHLCNFVDPSKISQFDNMNPNEKGDYYTYIGRLSTEKGVNTLLKAASSLPYTLKVAGGGPLSDSLRNEFKDYKNIEFLGHQTSSEVSNLLSNAKVSVICSECYENNPLSVIESLCAGTPVVGTSIGGIPELINPTNGLTATPGDADSISSAIEKAWNMSWNYEAIQQDAVTNFSGDYHYKKLMEIYQ